MNWGKCFDRIGSFTKEYFPGKTSAIDNAIKTGKQWILGINQGLKQDKVMTEARWGGMIRSYEADRELLYSFEVRPMLTQEGRLVMNTLAGWNAIGANVNPLCISEFATEATKACQINSFSEVFSQDTYNFINFGGISCDDYDERVDSFNEIDESGDFQYALKACIAIEQKLAQCHFHKNKSTPEVKDILTKLPGGIEAYKSDPPYHETEYALRDMLLKEEGDDRIHHKKIEDIINLPADVKRLVSALFEAGLASNDNLNLMFGKGSYVSYLIWNLKKQEEKKKQPRISHFITRTRIWKEGCTDNDKASGLKIKYLDKSDRSLRFDELRKLMPIGNIIQNLYPSIDHFRAKYGSNCSYVEELYHEYAESYDEYVCHGSSPKRRRCELDHFTTMEEACRYYFDTRSLEEAIWDHVGVPRIVVLNGNIEKMQEAGWTCKDTSSLGDETAKLGSRVAYVYDNLCSIWEEPSDHKHME